MLSRVCNGVPSLHLLDAKSKRKAFLPPAVTTKNVSRHYQMFPVKGAQNHPQLSDWRRLHKA